LSASGEGETEGLEREVKLVVRTSDPEAIVRRVAAARSLGSFTLSPRAPLTLKDEYFDTPERALSRLGCAVRVRREARHLFIALKAPTERSDAEVPERVELESAWSESAARELQTALLVLGVGTDTAIVSSSPEPYLESLGLQPLLRRGTRRRVRVLRRPSRRDADVGKMVIDRVDDSVGPIRVRHWEVEIEASPGGSSDDVRTAAQELSARFEPDLRRFDGSKLGIGLALRELRSELPGGLIDGNGCLTPKGFDAVQAILRSGTVTAA
jgi:inorganic triphosphatase YgiF